MRTFDPSLVLLLVLAALAATFSAPAGAQVIAPGEPLQDRAITPEAPVFFSEATELMVRLPVGWKGSESVDETLLPGRATYRWEAVSTSLAGTVIVVERVVGLNPLMQERWRRGQTASGYYGLRPTGAVPEEGLAFGPGAAFEIASGERLGRVYFTQRGEVFWSVHVSAPARVIATVPPLLDGLARGVRLSAKTVAPQQALR